MSAFQLLDLNFGVRSGKSQALGIAFLSTGVVVSVYALWLLSSAYMNRQHQMMESDLLTMRQNAFQEKDNVPFKVSAAQLQRFRNATLVINELRTPWDDLLKVLESAPMEQVALLSIEPIASRHQLRLAAEARDVTTMLDYLVYLQQQPALHQVILSSHQIQRQAPGSPVHFQIQAQWSEK